MIVCQNCGVEAPTKYVEFYQNIGALIMRFSKSIKGNLCKNCINEYFWSYTGITAILGWWGIISFIVTPFILLNNIVRYLGTLGLQPPRVGAASPRLTESAVTKIQPYTREIVERVNAGEKLEQVAQSVALRAGVTTGQVMLYAVALAQAAKKQ